MLHEQIETQSINKIENSNQWESFVACYELCLGKCASRGGYKVGSKQGKAGYFLSLLHFLSQFLILVIVWASNHARCRFVP